MDRRAIVAAFLAILLLILLGRGGIVSLIRRANEIVLGDGGEETTSLDAVDIDLSATFKAGPETWMQTTGLMCACDGKGYTGPVLVNSYEVPRAPLPRYVNVNP